MSNEITQEAIRDARHKGFAASTRHMDPKRREKLGAAYGKQDSNRERNITRFYEQVRGGGQS